MGLRVAGGCVGRPQKHLEPAAGRESGRLSRGWCRGAGPPTRPAGASYLQAHLKLPEKYLGFITKETGIFS